MSESLTDALHKIEGLVTDALGNRHSTFSVKFPYQVSFTFPEGDHNTTITIETTSEALRYGRDEQDIFLQMQLDQDHGRSTYAKHIIDWGSARLYNIDPKDVSITYGDKLQIDLMTDDQIDEFREACLDDE
ncbi:MAG: hypothetical protein OSB46_03255 [Alphaproteobacteria bacterium]|nr:hypothetical protein [Alphaproteobacteria bacterium]